MEVDEQLYTYNYDVMERVVEGWRHILKTRLVQDSGEEKYRYFTIDE